MRKLIIVIPSVGMVTASGIGIRPNSGRSSRGSSSLSSSSNTISSSVPIVNTSDTIAGHTYTSDTNSSGHTDSTIQASSDSVPLLVSPPNTINNTYIDHTITGNNN